MTIVDKVQTAQIANLYSIVNGGGGGVAVANNLAGGIPSEIPYQSASSTTSFIANGTSGQYLKSNGTSAPSWDSFSTPTLDEVLTAGNTALSGQTINMIDSANYTTNTVEGNGCFVEYDDGANESTSIFGAFGISHTSTTDPLNLTTNNVLDISANNIIADTATLALISGITNSILVPNLEIVNTNTTGGTAFGVPSVQSYKSGRNGTNNDIIYCHSFNAKNSIGTKTEFAKITTVIRNTGVGNDDGSISFFATLNGVSTEFMRINGADGDNNFLRPLDMNGSSILSNSGSLSINTSASTGTGTITLTPKPLGNLIFQNLPTSSVGLPTGAVWNNLGVLNIAP